MDLAPDVTWIGLAGLGEQWKGSRVIGTVQGNGDRVMCPAHTPLEVVNYLQIHLEIVFTRWAGVRNEEDAPQHPLDCLSPRYGAIFEEESGGKRRWIIVTGHPHSQETANAAAQIAVTRMGE
ncbi:hypothetical protein KGO04_01540 [Patescibacteria group bacterium]|nr:hypothetical protein [Patescibacteria group bacterium]MDE1945257.1 hypothetical protein [Patescibacteria group bacterium]